MTGILRFLYQILFLLITPFVLLFLRRKTKESALICQRRGVATVGRPQGAVIWFHGASRGEIMGLTSVMHHLRKTYAGATLLITTSAVSAGALARQLVPDAIHQLLPLDNPLFVKRFLAYWRPAAVIWTESDFWPTFFRSIQQKGLPFFLVNGRISEKAMTGWRFAKPLIRGALEAFKMIYAQTLRDQERFQALGLKNVVVLGNLKFFISRLAEDAAQQEVLRHAIGTRPLFMTASTHQGEEDILLHVYVALQQKHPDLLWFLIPRHPHRLPELLQMCQTHHLPVAVRSRGEPIVTNTQVYIADTFGEMGTFYGLAPFVVLAGSFLPIGGHTPVEPALADCVVLTGPHTFKNAEVFQTLETAGALLVASTPQDLQTYLADIYGGGLSLDSFRASARAVLAQQKDLQGDLLASLTSHLPQELR